MLAWRKFFDNLIPSQASSLIFKFSKLSFTTNIPPASTRQPSINSTIYSFINMPRSFSSAPSTLSGYTSTSPLPTSQPPRNSELDTTPYPPEAVHTAYEVGYSFDTIEEARTHVYTAILDRHESWKVYTSEQKRTILKCRGKEKCSFIVRMNLKSRQNVQLLRSTSHIRVVLQYTKISDLLVLCGTWLVTKGMLLQRIAG